MSSATWKWEALKLGQEEAGDQLLGGGTGEGESGRGGLFGDGLGYFASVFL